jgi:hypothetical protein
MKNALQKQGEPLIQFERRHPDLSALLKEMPPFVARNHPRFKELTGYSGRTFANMDCLHQTDAVKKIMLGNTVAYERESLVMWLESRSRIISEGRAES